MADHDKDMQELKKEVVEARNLVIKTDNLLKNLHADLKLVMKKQETFEKRSVMTSATAYILFLAASALGSYMYARSEIRATATELVDARKAKETATNELAKALASAQEGADESRKAGDLYERLASDNEPKRNTALTEVATLAPKTLRPLEVKALQDKAQSLRVEAAQSALEAGRTAFNRREFKTATQELQRHITLTPGKPDDVALLLIGQAHHALREWKDAVEPLQTFLKANPGSKNADYVALILGEALTESGDTQKAIETYRANADKYYQSQYAPWMRTRARKLEQAAREAQQAATAAQQQAAVPAPH